MSELIKKNRILTLGYQAPRGRRVNRNFNQIGVREMHYCVSHDFWFDAEEQDRLLHEGKPCIHTDYRYVESRNNFYKEGYMLHVNRYCGISLKAAKRWARKTRNLPVGTIVDINQGFYGVGRKSKKGFSLGYKFKITKENKFDPQYEISPSLQDNNFNTDEKARDLTNLLRANGFIVVVRSKNTNFLSSMISTAASHMGNKVEANDEDGEIATAYGHGMKIGYSSNNSTYRGYSNGVEDILFDKWDEFDKWSRCRGILKSKPNEEILKILLSEEGESKYSD